MRTAVLSDIHGNFDALTSVMADVADQRVDDIICLGDNIGYGAEPEKVVSFLIERGIRSVLGNHELALIDPSVLKWFNPHARRSIETTRQWLSPASIAYVQSCPRSHTAGDCLYVHGFPPDSVTTYLFQVSQRKTADLMNVLPQQYVFVGHTHELEILAVSGETLESHRPPPGSVPLDPGTKYLMNCGSVGQPRDGNPHAKYMILDLAKPAVETRFVPYDASAAARKIRDAGLPESHAARLL